MIPNPSLENAELLVYVHLLMFFGPLLLIGATYWLSLHPIRGGADFLDWGRKHLHIGTHAAKA